MVELLPQLGALQLLELARLNPARGEVARGSIFPKNVSIVPLIGP
jgi:hypothetical protein